MVKVRLDRTIERDGCECRGGPTDCCDQGWETVGAQKVERVSRKTSELLNPQDTRTECAWKIISVLIQGIAQVLSITVAQYFKMLLIYLFMQCSVSLTSVHSQKANTYHQPFKMVAKPNFPNRMFVVICYSRGLRVLLLVVVATLIPPCHV